jgi:hypothetical protein
MEECMDVVLEEDDQGRCPVCVEKGLTEADDSGEVNPALIKLMTEPSVLERPWEESLAERRKRWNAYPKLVHELGMLSEFVRLMGYDGEQHDAEELLKELGEKTP